VLLSAITPFVSMMILEIQGMGACRDMNPDSRNYSFPVFTRAGGNDDLTAEKVGSNFSRWYHKNVVVKCIEVLRMTDSSFFGNQVLKCCQPPAEYSAVLKYDGEMIYTDLSCVKGFSHPNLVCEDCRRFQTECAQANDMPVGFRNVKHFNRNLTGIFNDERQTKCLMKGKQNICWMLSSTDFAV